MYNYNASIKAFLLITALCSLCLYCLVATANNEQPKDDHSNTTETDQTQSSDDTKQRRDKPVITLATDPTKPYTSVSRISDTFVGLDATTATPKVAGQPTLYQIINSQSGHLAIIDGQMVKAGDKTEFFTVNSIGTHTVNIEFEGSEVILNLFSHGPEQNDTDDQTNGNSDQKGQSQDNTGSSEEASTQQRSLEDFL